MREVRESKSNNRKLGRCYEEVAVKYLIKEGYEILERNYILRSGEIDIIAKKDEVMVAFEVKYRSSTKFGLPSMAVNSSKQRKISKTFAYYLYVNHYSFENPYRFDVLEILADEEIHHIENAFDYVE